MREFVFQLDSQLVIDQYKKDNYKIVLDTAAPEGTCALYFSSHNIYYPNKEVYFLNRITRHDSYEWENIPIKGIRKHIFLRDVHKQWYLTGINSHINSPELLFNFLRQECINCQVITVGSSAGGYAAVLYGSQLNATKIFSFNGQMEIRSLLTRSSYSTDPLVFRFAHSERAKYYDLRKYISLTHNIYYFHSINSEWDARQTTHVRGMNIISIGFNSSRHGIPFLKCALPYIWGTPLHTLVNFSKSINNPIVFSVQLSGFARVVVFFLVEVYKLVTRFFSTK